MMSKAVVPLIEITDQPHTLDENREDAAVILANLAVNPNNHEFFHKDTFAVFVRQMTGGKVTEDFRREVRWAQVGLQWSYCFLC